LTQQLKQLALLLPQMHISTTNDDLQKYGKDWTTYFDIDCQAILFPQSTNDVAQITLWASQNKIPLVPSGGRTGLSGGACATNGEVVVSFEKMNRIYNFNEFERTVHCEAGVVTEALQNFATTKNLFYPVDFSAKGSSQIGGNIATNAGGIKVIRYGMTRNWVAGLTVVTGNGEVLSCGKGLIKNATGYDLRHLFIGSEGTLGFITEAQMQLTHSPEPSQVLLLACNSLEHVMQVFSEFQKKLIIVAFEMLAQNALEAVIKTTQLPAPFAEKSNFYIVCECEKKSEQDEIKILEVFNSCLEQGYLNDGLLAQNETQAKNFWRYRENISESLSIFSPYKNDISVPVSKVSSFVTKLDQVLKLSYRDWEVVWFGHIGDGNLHINILRPASLSKEKFFQECQKVDRIIFEVVRDFYGSISAEHGVGLTKKSFLNYTRSPAEINLMRQIKTQFDPHGIFNPGKLF
jgi:glycolate oxidase subunit GlcD